MPEISIIIVNHNGKGLLRECLESLRAQTYRDFEIIVVDNASTDGSADDLDDKFSNVRLIKSTENLGYGGGCNKGLAEASGRFIAFLNNDTKAEPGWLEALHSAASEDESVGMWASRIVDFDNPSIIDNTGLLLYRDGVARGRGRLETDSGQYDMPSEVFCPSGAASFFSRAMIEECGPFDDDFFMYMEDVDMGFRGRFRGYRCMYVPGAVIRHHYSATAQKYSALKGYLVERNRLWLQMKHFTSGMILASIPYTLWRYCLQLIGVLGGRGAAGRMMESVSISDALCVIPRAYASAIAGSGKMIGKRRMSSRLRSSRKGEMAKWLRDFGMSAREVALKD